MRDASLLRRAAGVMDAQAKEALRKENEEKCGPVCWRAGREADSSLATPSCRPRYGLSPEYIASVVLPAPVRTTHASAAVERQPQAGGHRAKGPAQQPRPADALTFSLMHGDASALSKSQLFALLRALHRKIASLRGAGPSCAPPDAAPAPADAVAEQAAKEVRFVDACPAAGRVGITCDRLRHRRRRAGNGRLAAMRRRGSARKPRSRPWRRRRGTSRSWSLLGTPAPSARTRWTSAAATSSWLSTGCCDTSHSMQFQVSRHCHLSGCQSRVLPPSCSAPAPSPMMDANEPQRSDAFGPRILLPTVTGLAAAAIAAFAM